MIRRSVTTQVMLAVAICSPAHGQAASELEGLWGFEYQAGAAVHGELVLSRSGATWTMRLAGYEVSAVQMADTVRLAVPGNRGTLRIHAAPTGPAQPRALPSALWIQPPSANGAPAYASPVRLHAIGPPAWRGLVRPLQEQFSLYLSVRLDAQGALEARFRNPERNFGGGRVFKARVDSGRVVLTDAVSGRQRFTQPFDALAKTIAFDFGVPLNATPRQANATVGFMPRIVAPAPYSYRAPSDLRDGWRVSRASIEGMSGDSLAALVRSVIAAGPLTDTTPRLHAVVVARHGRLVLDEYFFGYDATKLHDLRSASKTITSVLLGVAMYRGAPISEQRAITPAGATIGHLLTHTSGLACNDDDGASPGNEDVMQEQRKEPDWYRYTLALPQLHRPGTTYAYCSAGINLVGKAIRDATSQWLPQYFDQFVASPLGIETYALNLMPTGEGYAGGGLHMRPRDLLKVGQLYLSEGIWNGVRLVSRSWVRRSTQRQQPDSSGADDGYAWHRHTLRVGACAVPSYEASGNGGQFLLVIPSLDVVAVITAGNYGEGRTWQSIRERFVARYIASAVASASRC